MHAVDWLPTLADLAGLDAQQLTNKPLDGTSQWRALKGGSPVRDEVFYGFSGSERKGLAVKVGTWKLVRGSPMQRSLRLPHVHYTLDSVNVSHLDTPDLFQRRHAGERVGAVSDAWDFVDEAAEQLFDLASDPGETTNVAGAHPDIVARLGAKLDEYASQASDPSSNPAVDASCGDAPRWPRTGPHGLPAITPWCSLTVETLV